VEPPKLTSERREYDQTSFVVNFNGLRVVVYDKSGLGSRPDQTGVHEELGQAWSVLGRELEGLFDRWQEHFGSMGAREEGPPISMIIRNREKLDLSSDQVKNLERLRKDFEKQSIRKDADIRMAKLDLHALLHTQPVDIKNWKRKCTRSNACARIYNLLAFARPKKRKSSSV
jgi:hypothetical protein